MRGTRLPPWTVWFYFNRLCVCFFRSTLVSKEPESMLAHMFREKGDTTQKNTQLPPRLISLFAIWHLSSCVWFRCLGEQAGLSGGVPDRSQSRLLWTHSELSETRTAHHQRRHQPSGYNRHTFKRVFSTLQSFLIFSLSAAGVLEEARFFGIEQLAEQLETLIKVCECV